MFLNNAISLFIGHVAMSEDIIFVVLNWEWAGVYRESRDPAQHLTMYRMAPENKELSDPKGK